MAIAYEEFIQDHVASLDELATVRAIAHQLRLHLDTAEVRVRIQQAHQPGVSSQVIQATFLDYARELGFHSESRGLFAEYRTPGLRPDYYMPVGTTGILLEVERGKTLTNNMDLLDFWKCHLCIHANYLFLLIPSGVGEDEVPHLRGAFGTVSKRLSSFFDIPRNYTNVWGLFLFGY